MLKINSSVVPDTCEVFVRHTADPERQKCPGDRSVLIPLGFLYSELNL